MKRRAGWATVLVLAALAIPILRYESFDRAVLGRYSAPYFALICGYVALLLTAVTVTVSPERAYRSVFNKRLAYLLSMVVLALATGEATARILLQRRYMHGPPNFATRSRTAEYDIEIRTNSRGFRDVEHRLWKPRGVRRIAVIGDSFVWGSGVEAAESLPRLLERTLNGAASGERSADSVEVLSFGASGTGPVQYLKIFRGAARRYRPDLVIVCFFVGNDLRDAVREAGERAPRLALRGLLASAVRPWRPTGNTGTWSPFGIGSPIETGNLMQTARERGVPEDSIRARLARIPEDLVQDARAMRSNPFNMAEALLDPGAIEKGVLLEGNAAQAWPVVDRTLVQMDQEIRRAGARMLLLLIPAAGEIDRAYWAYSSAIGFRLDERLLTESPVQDHLTRLAASRGIPCVDLLPAFRASPDQNLYYVQDGHWTPNGHRLAAITMIERMRDDPALSTIVGKGRKTPPSPGSGT